MYANCQLNVAFVVAKWLRSTALSIGQIKPKLFVFFICNTIHVWADILQISVSTGGCNCQLRQPRPAFLSFSFQLLEESFLFSLASYLRGLRSEWLSVYGCVSSWRFQWYYCWPCPSFSHSGVLVLPLQKEQTSVVTTLVNLHANKYEKKEKRNCKKLMVFR